jgi:hypothetical protein
MEFMVSGRWLEQNKAMFVRDLVRDYCNVCAALETQRQRFEGDGTISYAVLRDLLGESIRKGVFWRLKDTAHHLFRCTSAQNTREDETTIVLWQYANSHLPDGESHLNAVEAMLDWCIGYAFHECVKLKEDAFLQQHYANRYTEMQRAAHNADNLFMPLDSLTAQTRESIHREIRRILHVLNHGLLLCVHYLAAHGSNKHLARFLYSEETLVRSVFGQTWPALIQALYQGDASRMYCLAATAYWEGGRVEKGLALLEKAEQHLDLGTAGQCLKKAMRQSPLPPAPD